MRWAVSLAVVAVALAGALWGMWHGWQTQARRSAALLPTLPEVPGDLGEPQTEPLEAVYVSTVRASDRLDRVVAHGLGVRSLATVQVFATGVLVSVPVSRPTRPEVRSFVDTGLFLAADRLRSVTTSAGQIGKMMRDDDAVVVLEWDPPAPASAPLASALRMRYSADQAVLLAAADAVLAVRPRRLTDDTSQPADRLADDEPTDDASGRDDLVPADSAPSDDDPSTTAA